MALVCSREIGTRAGRETSVFYYVVSPKVLHHATQ